MLLADKVNGKVHETSALIMDHDTTITRKTFLKRYFCLNLLSTLYHVQFRKIRKYVTDYESSIYPNIKRD